MVGTATEAELTKTAISTTTAMLETNNGLAIELVILLKNNSLKI